MDDLPVADPFPLAPIPFRLTPVGEGRGISCDRRGCHAGMVPLLERRQDDAGRPIWAARPQAELDQALSARYGHPIDISTKLDGISAVADALNRGDVLRAQRGTLAVKLPDPPAPGYVGVPSRRLTALLHQTGMLRRGQFPVPPAANDSLPGVSRPSNDNAMPQTLPKDPRVIPAQEFFFSEIPFDIPWIEETPTPPVMPWDFVRPRPGPIPPDEPRPLPPDWTVPIPRDIPGLRKDLLVNPYPERQECAEEWAEAMQYCAKQFRDGNLKPGYAGPGADFEKCVRGQVSSDCGGTKPGQDQWKRPRPKIDLTPNENPKRKPRTSRKPFI